MKTTPTATPKRTAFPVALGSDTLAVDTKPPYEPKQYQCFFLICLEVSSKDKAQALLFSTSL